MARQKCLVGGYLEGRVGLALPPPDREPSRFQRLARHQRTDLLQSPASGRHAADGDRPRSGGNLEMRPGSG